MFNHDRRFDIDLEKGQAAENTLATLLLDAGGGKVEVKSERLHWHHTGNIAVEYWCRGKASGISTTEADFWAFMFYADDDGLVFTLIVPVRVLKELCRQYFKDPARHKNGGDSAASKMLLVPIQDLIERLKRW